MRYQIDYTKFSSVFAVPSLSEQLLCTASREALQVLLYLMQHQQQPVDPGYLANRLMLPQEKALQALDYWVEQGFPVRERAGAASAATGSADCIPARALSAVPGSGGAAGAEADDGDR